MTQFTIQGNSWKYRKWKRRLDIAQRKVREYEDTVVDITTVLFPTPSLMVIKFTTTNNGNKYELTVQGKYASFYKEAQDGIEIQPEKVNAVVLINTRFDEAFQTNE